MPSRRREREYPPEEGYYSVQRGTNAPTITTNSSRSYGYYESCLDTIGERFKANSFTLHRIDRTSDGSVNGEWGSGPNKFRYDNFKVRGPSHRTALIPLYDDSKDMNRVLAQSGPLSPRIYTPVSVFELRELPSMLKHAGDLLLGIRKLPKKLTDPAEIASATLAYQFGWAPLIEDIGKMLNFSELVRKKQREIAKANSRDGLRRRVTLDKSTSNNTVNSEVHGSLGRVNFHQTMTREVWATARWHVRDLSQIGKVPSFTDSFKTAYGLNRGHIPISVWKALPWSWAIDWFADISNIMSANYNTLYYKPTRVCFMQKRITTSINDPKTVYFSSGEVEIGSGSITTTHLSRRVVSNPTTSLSLKLPFLDNFKLSILGSMSVLAIRRRQR